MEVQDQNKGNKPKVSYAEFMKQLPEKRKGTVAWAIETYIREMTAPNMNGMGKSQMYTLQATQRDPIGSILVEKLEDTDIVDFVKRLRSEPGRHGKPRCAATANQYVTFLVVAIKNIRTMVKGCKHFKLDPFKDAKPTLERLRLVSKSQPRTRRPTQDEQDRIIGYFKKHAHRHSTKIPMVDISEFAVVSCRRISETCRLKWGDVDFERRTCWVRDLKNCKGKGFHGEFPLLGRAWDIVMAQPRLDPNNPAEYIFKNKDGTKINPKSASQAHARARADCGIVGLRFHDYRREGTSRLFEEGYSVPEVAKVTQHRNPSQLLGTYTQLKPEDLHKGPASKRVAAQPT